MKVNLFERDASDIISWKFHFDKLAIDFIVIIILFLYWVGPDESQSSLKKPYICRITRPNRYRARFSQKATSTNKMLVSLLQSLEEIPLPYSNKVGISNFVALLCPMKLIICVFSTATTISMLLPQENVEGRPVPTFFRDRPTNYYMFLISTLYAVVGAFSALLIPHKPKVERFFRMYAVASMLSALALCGIQAYSSANVFQRPKIP